MFLFRSNKVMDNRINETRWKISDLRARMPAVEDVIRDQINRDQDCTEASLRLMAMRAELASLVAEWRAAGGSDPLPTLRERQANRKMAPARR
jgi:chorismate mutase